MSAPPRDFAEPAPAGEAPTVIHLPYVPPPTPEKKKPKRRRGYGEHFRTDEDEHAALIALAQAEGLSLGAYYRQKLIGDPGPRSKRAAPTEQGHLTVANHMAVNRVGANVNQGIRALNEIALKAPQATSRDRLADELMGTRELLRASLAAVEETLAALRAAIGR
jgi:hypothetical protein